MRRLGSAPARGIGAVAFVLAALCPVAHAQDAQPPNQGAWVGMTTRALTDAWRESKGYTASGVMVVEVAPGGPADQLGVSPGDVLVTIDSKTMRQPADLAAAEAAMVPGRPVEVILARDGGRSFRIFSLEPAQPRPQASGTSAGGGSGESGAGAAGAGAAIGTGVAIGAGAADGGGAQAGGVAPTGADAAAGGASTGTGAAPGANAGTVSGGDSTPVPPLPGQVSANAGTEPAATPSTKSDTAAAAEGPRDAANGLGVRCENLTLDLATAMKAPAGQGVLVLAVTTGSPADKAGIRPGDVISRAGGQPVPDVGRLDEIMAAASTPLSIVTTRSGTTRVVAADLSHPVAPPTPAEPVVEPKPAVEMTQEQLLASLRDEVRTLRDEVRKLREEMANWARATRPQP